MTETTIDDIFSFEKRKQLPSEQIGIAHLLLEFFKNKGIVEKIWKGFDDYAEKNPGKRKEVDDEEFQQIQIVLKSLSIPYEETGLISKSIKTSTSDGDMVIGRPSYLIRLKRYILDQTASTREWIGFINSLSGFWDRQY